MREIRDERMQQFETLALESLKQLSAYFTYAGTDPRFFQKARVGVAMIGAYARLRASETNRMAVELSTEKVAAELADRKPKELNA